PTAPSTQLTHVTTGRDLTIVYGDSPDGAGARRRYLAEVIAECELLPWRVVNPNFADPDRSANLSLADIYTELSTTELRQIEREEELRQFMALREVVRVSAQQIADEAPHLLVMGDPGSGKSTFVKHLAYTLAKANLA